MQPADLTQVLAIEGASFGAPWSQSLFEAELAGASSSCWVAETQGRQGEQQIAGYLCLSVVLDEGDIRVIAVAPGLRRKGVARQLLNHGMEQAKAHGAVCMHLEVRAGNTAALALYESLSFQVTGRRKNYYTNPLEDAITLTRRPL